MRHSVYITLATWFIGADIRRQERAFQRKLRRTTKHIPWHSEHLLRDIGFMSEHRVEEGSRFPLNQMTAGYHVIADQQTKRRLYHLHRLSRLRILT